MEKENRLHLMHCPQCARGLKVANETRKVICPYCEKSVRPLQQCPPCVTHNADLADGIANLPAAASYVRFYFDTFDWDTWLLSHRYTVEATDRITCRFMQTASYDAATWLLAFDCLYIPVIRKTQGFSAEIDRTAELYLNGKKQEAGAHFDSVLQAVRFLQDKSEDILRQLVRFSENAHDCGADENTYISLQEKIVQLRANPETAQCPKNVEEIPAVKSVLEQNNRILSEQFAEIGIDIETEYRKIGSYLAQKQFKDAVFALQRFAGYKNTSTLLKEVNRLYRFAEVIQITGRLYIERNGALYALENGKPSAEPLIKNVAQLLAVYADRLLYTDTKNKLIRFDLTEKTATEFDRKRTFADITAVPSADPSVLYCTYRSRDGKGAKVFARFDADAFQETVLFEDTDVIHTVADGILLYTDSKGETFAADLASNEKYSVCRNKIELCATDGKDIVYTRNAPTPDNKNLYTFTVGKDAREKTAATNIYSLCCVHDKKAYYTVGNKLQRSLYCTDLTDNSKKQLLTAAYTVEWTASDAVYASCGDAYNRILHRIANKNGEKMQITDNIQKVLGIHCGRLIYTDTDGNLCSIIPDGTDKKTLFAQVKDVLMMHGGVLFFLAADEVHLRRDEAGATHIAELLSLYSVNTDATMLQKHAHGIANAQCFNDREIDFFKNAATSDGGTARWLFRYDTKSGEIYKLLEYTVGGKKGK